MKRRTLLALLAGALLFCAAVLLLYPVRRTRVVRQAEREEIKAFSAYLEEQMPPVEEQKTPVPFERLLEACRAYNERLLEACRAYNERIYAEEQCDLDGQTMQEALLNLTEYDYAQEVFAVLSCPTVELEVPVYLGASAAHLNQGVAVLGQTSLPVGGENTNCVIAGHRSWNAAIRFRSIEDLQPGDRVYLTNPWETLTYQVVAAETICPSAIEAVRIKDGRQLLTLFTCTAPNTHRYLVLCEAVP